jgi:hypothetical protein
LPAKARGLDAVRIEDWAVLDQRGPLLLALLDVDGERYYLPLAVSAAAGRGRRESPASGHGSSSRATPIPRSG